MKSIFKRNFFGLGVILVIILFVGIFIQSCDSDETVEVFDEKIESLAQSNDLQIYSIAFETYKKKTINAIKSLDIEEREKFFNNLNNDDYMMSFLEKNDLIESNIALQKSILSLDQNLDWISLNNDKKRNVLAKTLNSDITTFPKVRSGSESGSECEQIFLDGLADLNLTTYLAIALCTCTIGSPPTACICYVIAMRYHYQQIQILEDEREQCEGNR